ncbi:MAG: LAGLIDADG family homing endonuclease, partial [Candidatus Aenigmatarchaeota archaeon]
FKTEKKPLIPRFIKVDVRLAELLGLYCAEGHISKYKKRPPSFHLVFSFGKKEKKPIEKTVKILKETFKIEPKIVKRKTTITVEMGKTSIALFFKLLCGDNCKNKEVPSFILYSNKSIIRAFIKGFLEGDGWVGKNAIDLCTTSKKLAFGIYFLFLRLGILPSFYEIKPKNEKGKIEDHQVNLSTSYRIKIVARMFRNRLLMEKSKISKRSISSMKVKETNSHFLIRIREIQRKLFEGDVYNLEIDGNPHSYLANFISVGNCCNWLISHDGLPEIFGDKYEPEEIVNMAEERNCNIISHTYTEPTIYFEFAYEVAKLAHRKGMLNTFVTNGYMSLQALRKISKFLNAATVDFKASNDPSFLLKYSSVPSSEPVFEFLKSLKKYGIHTEITNLIVPQIGDNLDQFRKVVKWIIENLGPDIPFHVLRFHPDYMLTEIPVTPVETLESFIEEAKKLGLKYVYIGNVPGHRYENTYCPNCNELLIERTGFWVEKVNLEGDKCRKCGEKIKIVV